MKAKEIFPLNVYGSDFLGFDQNYLNQLEASIELIRRGNIDGNELQFSNTEFGWQSRDLPQDGPFEKLTQGISKQCFDFCNNINNFKISGIQLKSMWANINYQGDVNWPHRHQGDISGVYYINVNDDSGDLTLDNFSYNIQTKISNHLQQLHGKVIKPKNDMLVLFDSNCWHSVSKNKSNTPRMSVSFNCWIHV